MGTEEPPRPALAFIPHPQQDGPSAMSSTKNERTIPTILVVDDDAIMRQLATICLRHAHYNVVCAATGHEALALFQQQPIHLVILDLVMPGMDGIAVAEALRACSGVPILMLSAQTQPDIQARALRRGVNLYLSKPIRLAELQAAAHGLLASGALAQRPD